MPIKGVSDNLMIPRIGKIRLGSKALTSNNVSYPKATDYFVYEESIPHPAIVNKIRKHYGEKPTRLKIMFPVGDPEIIFPHYYKKYGSTYGLICKGNGETATYFDEETGEMKERKCLGDNCPDAYKAGKKAPQRICKMVANLTFFLLFPTGKDSCPYELSGGVFQIDTSSFYTIRNINSFIQIHQPRMIETSPGTFVMQESPLGNIAWKPLELCLNPFEAHPRAMKRMKKTVYVLSLVPIENVPTIKALPMPEAEIKALIGPTDEEEIPEHLYANAWKKEKSSTKKVTTEKPELSENKKLEVK